MLVKAKPKVRTKRKSGYDNLLKMAEKMQYDSKKNDQKVDHKEKLLLSSKTRVETLEKVHTGMLDQMSRATIIEQKTANQSELYSNELKTREKEMTRVFEAVVADQNLGIQYMKKFEADLNENFAFLTMLKNLLSQERNNLARTNQRIKSTSDMNQSLDANIDQLGKKIEEKKASIASLKKNGENMQAQLDLENTKNNEMLEEMKKMRVECKELTERNKEGMKAIHMMEEELKEKGHKKTEVENLRNKFKEIIKMVEGVKNIENIATNKNFCKDLRATLSPLLFHMRNELNYNTEELDQRKERLIAREYEIRKLQSEIRTLESLRGDYKKRLENDEVEIQKLDEEIKENKAKSTTASVKLAELVEQEGFGGKDLEQMEKDVKFQKENVKKKRQLLGKLKEEMTMMQVNFEKEMAQKKRAENALLDVLKEPGNNEENLKNLIQEAREEIIKVRAEVLEKRNQYQQLLEEKQRKIKEGENKARQDLLTRRENARLELEELRKKTQEGVKRLQKKKEDFRLVMEKISREGIEGFPEPHKTELLQWKASREEYYDDQREMIDESVQKTIEEGMVEMREENEVKKLSKMPVFSEGDFSANEDDFAMFGGDFDLFGDF